MRIRSLRLRLLILNIGVLILCLLGSGLLIHLIVQTELQTQSDAQLVASAQRAAHIASVLLAADPKSEKSATELIQKLHGEMGSRSSGQGPVPDQHTNDDLAPQIFGPTNKPLMETWFGLGKQERPYDSESLKTALLGRSSFRTIFVDSHSFRLLSYPVIRGETVLYVVQVGQSNRVMSSTLGHLDRVLFHLIPVAVLIATVSGLFLSAASLKPIGRMVAGAREISARNLTPRLPAQGDRELAELSSAFNQLLDRLESSFETQKRFIADASHELRTPLAAIKVNTSTALSGPPSVEEYGAALSCADRAADRMTRLVGDLLFLSRSDANQLLAEQRRTDLGEIADSLCDSFGGLANQGEVLLSSDVSARFFVVGDADLIERLLGNIIANALAHTASGGSVTVSAQAEGRIAKVMIIDTGCGIAPEHLPYLFDRFYRADHSRSRNSGGTGLGLSISRSIAEALNGSIDLASEPGIGTVVTIRLAMAGSGP